MSLSPKFFYLVSFQAIREEKAQIIEGLKAAHIPALIAKLFALKISEGDGIVLTQWKPSPSREHEIVSTSAPANADRESALTCLKSEKIVMFIKARGSTG